MKQITYRANLAASWVPFRSDLHGRSIIYQTYDQYYVRAANPQDDDTLGIPQIYYMENVLPVVHGIRSVSFSNFIYSGLPPGLHVERAIAYPTPFHDTFIYYPALPDGTRNFGVYGIRQASGAFSSWIAEAPLTATPSLEFTYASVVGRFFLCYGGVQISEVTFTPGGAAIAPVALTGLSITNINGIIGVGNYLVAWSNDTIYWSSLLDPLDFTSSLSTGAGSQKITALRGVITTVAPIPAGFIVYTTANAIAALATDNTNFPWVFRELPNSAAVASIEHVAYEHVTGVHYVWSTAGLQRVSRSEVENVFPQLTDYLRRGVAEKYAYWRLQDVPMKAPLQVKVNFVMNRYITISYALDSDPAHSYSHLLIYDTHLKRWGKVIREHGDVIQVGDALCLVQTNGVVLKLDQATESDKGVVILGRYQFFRTHEFQINSIAVENCINLRLAVLRHVDGTNNTYITEARAKQTYAPLLIFQCSAEARAHSIAIEGAFDLHTVEIDGYTTGEVSDVSTL